MNKNAHKIIFNMLIHIAAAILFQFLRRRFLFKIEPRLLLKNNYYLGNKGDDYPKWKDTDPQCSCWFDLSGSYGKKCACCPTGIT